MAERLHHSFDDLPLFEDRRLGLTGPTVSGECVVEYDEDDGDFDILYLKIWTKDAGGGEELVFLTNADEKLATLIEERLSDDVSRLVGCQIAASLYEHDRLLKSQLV